ncbi:SIR2 family protein [Bradyrhizobium sp. AT1]|uniref:SIR2 family NAD-dependent protein deacylase n=1 Tax=Bradyrhizobium sp. AT1 TaxID=574934 RepID=UPI0018DC75B3|nr:SIR2 family protein [Bradyrhizobium sp. AT1]
MIGAGFSRNADPVSSTSRQMPNWYQMATALCEPLYPLDSHRRQKALEEAGATSGFLRLAQEYEVAFGASSLSHKIRDLVPDTDYRPSDLHKRLLRLPWADVFSTNWDTLLERACSDVFERSYDIVRTVGDIPFTARPRIVKLHGSFPGHQPFVFTEEDYRTYPTKFSPFVNLVQQSMMETIFCLIGFSGDDPNFLHWSGWVRDHLGPSGPKIYLVGWLELSVHRRRMLEARNVMPVDLSALPSAIGWPEDLRHRYASEWFIAALEAGRPYSAASWPAAGAAPAANPDYLGSIPLNPAEQPREDFIGPSWDKPKSDREDALRATIGIWAHNRRLYPGWLIAPERVRNVLWHRIGNWLSEFALLSGMSLADKLRGLAELAWGMSCALLPFPPDQEDLAFEVLSALDQPGDKNQSAKIEGNKGWPGKFGATKMLALALARNARRAGDRAKFEHALNFTTPLRAHDSELRNAVIYEECLWHAAIGDLPQLLRRLDEWMPAEGEGIWSLRKAGLLAEMHESTRACALLEETLTQIRRGRRRDVDDLVSLSLESWALFLGLAFTNRIRRYTPSLPKGIPEPFERWRALGIVDCDAFSEYRSLTRILEVDRPPPTEVTKTRAFDLGHVSTTHHLASTPSETVVAAYQMVMLAEATGIPAVASHMKLFDDGLRLSTRTLVATEPWLASQLAVRIGYDDKLTDEVFSRVNIARFPRDLVPMLKDSLMRRISFGLALIGTHENKGRDGTSIVNSSLEILSRVAVRLAQSELIVLFDQASAYYLSSKFRQQSLLLGRSLAHLFERVFESLSRGSLAELLPRLFALPLPHERGSEVDARNWPDPVGLLPEWCEPPALQDPRSPLWEAIISRLLAAAKGPDSVDRGAAVLRLLKLLRWNFLNEQECRQFGEALWAPELCNTMGLPEHTNLRTWVLLVLPEPSEGKAREAVTRVVGTLAKEGAKLHSRLEQIGELLHQANRLNMPIELSAAIKSDLVDLVGRWAEHRPSAKDRFARMMNRDDVLETNALAGVVEILSRVEVEDDIVQRIWDKSVDMDTQDEGPYAFAIYPFLARRWPTKKPDLLDRLRQALVSDKEERVNSAVHGLYSWLAREPIDQPGDEDLEALVREIGIAIAARRHVLLVSGLGLAEWIFREGPSRLRNLIVRDCDHGLVALLDEASYARSDQSFDVPAVRAGCIKLASSMIAAGHADSRGAQSWLEESKTDPLPEVRNARDRRGV